MFIVSTLGLEEEYQMMLKEKCPQHQVEHMKELSALTKEQLSKTEVLFTYGYDMEPRIVEQMKNLRWVHSGQAGIDAMPRKLLDEMGVFVSNSRGINSVTIAEYVMCMLLNLERNTYRFYEAFKQHRWDMETHLDEVMDKKLTILGMGKVGLEVAKRAKGFDMEVTGVNLVPVISEYVDHGLTTQQMKEAISDCDYLVICMPLTEETHHMVNKEFLSHMKESAVLMNVGRGPIVKTQDLVDVLKQKKQRMAILDVLEEEPCPSDSLLWELDNLMITPHIAGDRQKSYMPRMMRILTDNLNKYPDFTKMENPVNIKLGF